MTPSIILSAAALTAARIGGGVVSPGPAVTSFADSRASVAPTVSGYRVAGFAQGLPCSPCQLAGGFGSRRFSQFSAVAGSSSPRADVINGAGFVSGPDCSRPQTPGADGANRVNAGGYLA